MSEMLERVTRALYEAQIETKVPDDLWSVAYNSSAFKETIDSAREAITAIREPTEQMLGAAREAAEWVDFDSSFEKYRTIWRAMAEEALK